MDTANRPGQTVQYALSSLRNIETDGLATPDKRRVEVARRLLTDISFRADVGHHSHIDDGSEAAQRDLVDG